MGNVLGHLCMKSDEAASREWPRRNMVGLVVSIRRVLFEAGCSGLVEDAWAVARAGLL